MRKILLTTLLLISFSISADEINKMATIDGEKIRETGNYSEETCQKINDSIGYFLHLADIQWKKENEKKAMFYSTASANYSIVFQTICLEPKIIKTQNSLNEDLLDMYYKMPTFLLDD